MKFRGIREHADPSSLGTGDIKAYLTWLAVSRLVSASSQNQALNAVLFFYRHVLKKDIGEHRDVVRAKYRPDIPVVLSRREVDKVIRHLDPPYELIIKMLYGCGLQLSECLQLRVRNFDLKEPRFP